MQLDLGAAITSFQAAKTALIPADGATSVPVEKLVLSASEAKKGIDALADDAKSDNHWVQRNALASIEYATAGVELLQPVIDWYQGENDLPLNDQAIAATVESAKQQFVAAETAQYWE